MYPFPGLSTATPVAPPKNPGPAPPNLLVGCGAGTGVEAEGWTDEASGGLLAVLAESELLVVFPNDGFSMTASLTNCALNKHTMRDARSKVLNLENSRALLG